jgi:hypothetical protein
MVRNIFKTVLLIVVLLLGENASGASTSWTPGLGEVVQTDNSASDTVYLEQLNCSDLLLSGGSISDSVGSLNLNDNVNVTGNVLTSGYWGSNTNPTIRMDADNNGSNYIDIKNGAATSVLYISENGDIIQNYGGFYGSNYNLWLDIDNDGYGDNYLFVRNDSDQRIFAIDEAGNTWASGVLRIASYASATTFYGDGSHLTGLIEDDTLGTVMGRGATASTDMDLQSYDIENVSNISAVTFQTGLTQLSYQQDPSDGTNYLKVQNPGATNTAFVIADDLSGTPSMLVFGSGSDSSSLFLTADGPGGNVITLLSDPIGGALIRLGSDADDYYGILDIIDANGYTTFQANSGSHTIAMGVATQPISLNINGSMSISGNATAAYFFGDGSNLTNLPLGNLQSVTDAGSDTTNGILVHGDSGFGNNAIIGQGIFGSLASSTILIDDDKTNFTNTVFGVANRVRALAGVDTAQDASAIASELVISDDYNYTGILAGNIGIVRHEHNGKLGDFATMKSTVGNMGRVENIASGTVDFGIGTVGTITNTATGTVTFGIGVGGRAVNEGPGIFTEAAVGVMGTAANLGTGSILHAAGIAGGIENNGTIDAAVSGMMQAPQNTGTIGTVVGLIIEDHSGVGISASLNLLSEGVASENVFEGNVEAATYSVAGNPGLDLCLQNQETSGGATMSVKFESGILFATSTSLCPF